ncbi:hypothetical protein H072_10966 [Dactylellina haptotyla CBS 200.50]|uniref:NFACT RNA-binding domain-containing protein n=1 Tax=Dactylellina haptotyla (strain CBS 200.50) TaxID=1284197 RepID=S8BK27_DACHA|nr:hypothetical protein H072_10966 [Dactylellina haptotyla CBS 200.50]
MKQRFSSLDVQVICHELQHHLLSHRLSNIHDLSSRTFQFKFQSSATQTRHILIVDSGFRCHLTNFSRTVASSPGGFVEKLRKCLKTRRVTGVRQVGSDRVVEIQFGIVDSNPTTTTPTTAAGDAKEDKAAGIPGVGGYRLFFEFFAGGNVILTDAALNIITLLRIVPEGPNQKKVAKGEVYDISDRKTFGVDKVAREQIVSALKSHIEKREKEDQKGKDGLKDWQKRKLKKTRKDEGLNRVLGAAMTEFSATLIEHCLLSVGVNPDLKVADVVGDEATIDKIFEAFQTAETMVKDIIESKEVTGWIIAKKPQPKTEKAEDDADKKKPKKKKKVAFGDAGVKEAEEDLEAMLEDDADIVPQTDASGFIYDDFHPFLPLQYKDKPNIHAIPIPTYNKTVDSFFSSIESQKMEQRTAEKKAQAAKRLANARNEHKSKIASLQQTQELHVRKAQAIEANIDRVEEVADAVNSLIAQGMDWTEIRNLIQREKNSGNLVAEMIKDVKFMENVVVIRLYEEEDDDDSEDDESGSEDEEEREKKRIPLDIDIDLGLTGYANARIYYEQKRSAAVKEERTLQSSAKALKSTEKKIQKDLKQAYKAEKMELRTFRRTGWWEKFYWFKSSEGYLVLGAKDPMQADMLYKKYFKRGDVWVHADVSGSCHVLVKNKIEDMKAPISPGTLSQAGALAVASSDAWEKKQVISAWWAEYDQVGKIGAGGIVLSTGEFSIKGEKRWLPPAMLVMGFAVGWVVSEGDEVVDADADEPEVNGGEELPSIPEGAAEDVPAEESSDEEFPDAKLESEEDTNSDNKADFNQQHTDDSDSEEFPDAKLEDLSLEETNPPSQEEDEIAHPSIIDRTAASSPSPSIASTALGPRHLSAKEKRDIKKAKAKGLSLPASALATPNGSVPPIERKQMKAPAAPRSLSSKQTQQKVRGKKGKSKKIAEKYADQDEEDRALALKLLGNAKKETDAAVEAFDKEKEKKETRLKEAEERQLRLKLQVEKMRSQVLADEEIRKDTADKLLDFEEELDESNALKIADLKRIVPEVKIGDLERLVDAIPVCAPWSALQKFEWKVKLQPGTQKKGKAIREVVERWGKEVTEKRPMKPKEGERGSETTGPVNEMAEKVKREKELVRAWKEAELVQSVPVGKVKVMIPGMLEEKGKGGKGGGKSGGGGGKKGKK